MQPTSSATHWYAPSPPFPLTTWRFWATRCPKLLHKKPASSSPDAVVLSSDNPMDVTCLVQETALQKRAPLTIPAMTDCQILSETLESTTFQYRNFAYTLHMPGRHQVYNALTAIEVIRFLGMHGFLSPLLRSSRHSERYRFRHEHKFCSGNR